MRYLSLCADSLDRAIPLSLHANVLHTRGHQTGEASVPTSPQTPPPPSVCRTGKSIPLPGDSPVSQRESSPLLCCHHSTAATQSLWLFKENWGIFQPTWSAGVLQPGKSPRLRLDPKDLIFNIPARWPHSERDWNLCLTCLTELTSTGVRSRQEGRAVLHITLGFSVNNTDAVRHCCVKDEKCTLSSSSFYWENSREMCTCLYLTLVLFQKKKLFSSYRQWI